MQQVQKRTDVIGEDLVKGLFVLGRYVFFLDRHDDAFGGVRLQEITTSLQRVIEIHPEVFAPVMKKQFVLVVATSDIYESDAGVQLLWQRQVLTLTHFCRVGGARVVSSGDG